ncbi:Asp-tRNA(Asn)/Glu-tRNA(Gln) amidotransferase subunit GatA [Patescibacteria group bacterium]|nr:Asp-tRNA(Asn)/Glu-tRNA(Gln) amidotransferase subunit GatA [Patescibacteria group bacterium]
MEDLHTLTITQAIHGLKDRKFTSVDLTNACLHQIQLLDADIKAFITVTADAALEKAREADKLIAKDTSIFESMPLLGIPYALKDNFSTKGVQTTASSKILKDYIPPFDATVTAKINAAGAIMLGKTNMDAFAHGSSTETSDFFETKNPWDITRVPGGSSGGSAAALAADMCIFAIGSETAGSIRGPAGWCGVTGFKPSYGRVSRYGVVAMASSTDSPGPLTKTVEDAAYILQVIAGADENDATSAQRGVENYVDLLGDASLKGLRIGLPKSYFEIDMEPEVKKLVLNAVEICRSEGAEIIEIDLMDPKYSIAVYTILQRSEVSSNLARFDGIRFGHNRDAFGFEARKRMMLGAYTLSAGYYDAFYSKAQKVRTLLVEDLNRAFSQVDLIIAPTMPCIALKLGESKNSSMFGELMDILFEQSSVAGICGVSVPCGISNGLPVGVQFMGDMFEEGTVLRAAHAFQKSTKFHLERPILKNGGKF